MSETRAVVRVLFVCQQNRRRSATAERVFCKRADWDVRSAGVGRDALVRINGRMLDWADRIFVMEERHRRELEQAFPDHPSLARIVSLQIPDEYAFLDPELIALLQSRVAEHLERA